MVRIAGSSALIPSLATLALGLAACGASDSQQGAAGDAFVVDCSEPLPDFTLGPDSKPTEAQVTQLCACIWESLGDWERETAKAISEGREQDVSRLNMAAFPGRFGKAIEKCGGMKL